MTRRTINICNTKQANNHRHNTNNKHKNQESRNPQKGSSSKPEKQPKTQKAKPESRNFPPHKSRNLKISSKKQPEKTQNSLY
jgi:hypothetical protein